MAYLIDGYNLMHAMVDVRSKLRPAELQGLRRRFLNDLARRLGPGSAAETTVVFDASGMPASAVSRPERHQGMTIRYTADADDWIEAVLGEKGTRGPSGWVVVSSDRRIREAARRRKVACLTTDEFLNRLDAARPALRFEGKPEPRPESSERPPSPTGAEAAYWRAEFRELIAADEANRPLRRSDFVPSDEEIARIAREVEREED